MLTRKEIEENYEVENGRIRSPGAFEGEAIYLPYFWSQAMEGFADRDDGKTFTIFITKEDKKLFPELGNRRKTVKMYQTEQGFICER